MQLPINMIIIIVIVVIVLVVIGSFFMLSGSKTIGGQQEQVDVAKWCGAFSNTEGLTNAYIDKNYPDFSNACRRQFGMEPIQCVTRYCGQPTTTRGACENLCLMVKWASDKEDLCNKAVASRPDYFGACNCETAIKDAASGGC